MRPPRNTSAYPNLRLGRLLYGTNGALIRRAVWLVALSSGCAWRTSSIERYFGPVLIRQAEACDGGTAVQTRHFALLGEGGSQWGLSLGFVDRVALFENPRSERCPDDAPRRSAAAEMPGGRMATRFVFHPLFTRLDRIGDPAFVRRTLIGLQAIAGAEGTAVSTGWTTRTRFDPPGDAVSLLRFNATRPLEARLVVWRAGRGDPLPVTAILKEVKREEAP